MKKRKVIVTRPRKQADSFADQLEQAGLEPVFFPVIEIQPIQANIPLQRALAKLEKFDWVVFTSVNGVEVVWDTWENMKRGEFPPSLRVAAIGPKTAEALVSHRVTPAFIPQEYIAEAIVPGMGVLAGKKVLLPRAEIARNALPEAISAAGGIVHEVPVYQTVPAIPDPHGLQALREGVDVISLTSSSTVHNFVSMVQQAGFDPLHLPGDPIFACIGPVTRRTAREKGLLNLVMAEEYTTAGLVRAIQAHFAR